MTTGTPPPPSPISPLTYLSGKTAFLRLPLLPPRGGKLKKKKQFTHPAYLFIYLFILASEKEKLVEEEGAEGGNLVTRRHSPGKIFIRRTYRERHPFRKWLFQTRWAI